MLDNFICKWFWKWLKKKYGSKPKFLTFLHQNYLNMDKKTSSKNLLPKDQDYKNILADLKSIITKSQYHAYKAVDNIRVQTYWQLGERIVREELKHKDRADYGKYLIDNLSIIVYTN